MYAVVVHPEVAVTDLSQSELRNIFLFKQRFWHAGHPVTVLLSEEALGSKSLLLEMIYRTDKNGLRLLVLEQMYRGELDLPPKFVTSDRDAVRYVTEVRGPIALVSHEALEGAAVKVLSIDGTLPGEKGYPLRR